MIRGRSRVVTNYFVKHKVKSLKQSYKLSDLETDIMDQYNIMKTSFHKLRMYTYVMLSIILLITFSIISSSSATLTTTNLDYTMSTGEILTNFFIIFGFMVLLSIVPIIVLIGFLEYFYKKSILDSLFWSYKDYFTTEFFDNASMSERYPIWTKDPEIIFQKVSMNSKELDIDEDKKED